MHISECANVWQVLQQLLGVCEKFESVKVSVFERAPAALRTSLHLRLFVCILHRLSVLLILGDQDEQKRTFSADSPKTTSPWPWPPNPI